MRSPSRAVGTTLEDVASAADVVQGLSGASRSLFGKMKVFCDLMDLVTEVCVEYTRRNFRQLTPSLRQVQPYSRMAWMVISAAQKVAFPCILKALFTALTMHYSHEAF